MIARIAGRLEEIADAAALIDAGGGLWYEVMIPAFEAEMLSRRLGQDVVLHTIHYFEGNPSHGQQAPRLIGFLAEADRTFFKVFTTVKGIGIRKALRALVRPPAEVATAVQARDAKFLQALPEIGARMADRIIAELHGKLDEFAGEVAPEAAVEMPEAGAEAAAVLVQLGEKRADAMALIERVLTVAPELESPEAIIQQAYKLKGGGR